jgi:hypothetical protein
MALEVVDQLVRSSAVDIIAIDSVAALTPRAEIEGEIGNIQGGCTPACLLIEADLWSQAVMVVHLYFDGCLLPRNFNYYQMAVRIATGAGKHQLLHFPDWAASRHSTVTMPL